jgi:fructose-1,6-bisphosphatase/inositol monophosphatase family enzyme
MSLRIEMEKLIELGIEALKKSFDVHNELSEEGLKEIQKNEHGDTSLLADIECEKAIIDIFKKNKTPLRIISEEHGQIDLSENPLYLAVLDGLDGTSVYKKERNKGRYGTMFGIFSNLNPNYDDYIFCGVMEHTSNRLYYAIKDKGSFLIENNKEIQIKCSKIKQLNNKTKIYADEAFDRYKKIDFIYNTFLSKLKEFNFLKSDSSAIHYVDLAQGKADLVLECTRKGNLEIAVAFGLINEANGVIVTDDGKSIGDQKYLKLGQKEHIPIISASTIELANELIKKIT